MLEGSHKFCVNSMQGLDRYMRLCYIGTCPLAQEIRKKKMILFGQLGRLAPYYMIKRRFTYSFAFMYYFNDKIYEFVLDALNITAG